MNHYEDKICNALEGYRLELEKPLDENVRHLYESLFGATFSIAEHYHVCVDMYERWWVQYVNDACIHPNTIRTIEGIVEDYLQTFKQHVA